MKNRKGKINNCIKIFYKPKESLVERIRIFGEKFVEKNRNKCKIIYNNKEYELTEFFENVNNNYKDSNNQIIIKLRILTDIIDMSYIFCECKTLLEFIILPKNVRPIENDKEISYSNMDLTPELFYYESYNKNDKEKDFYGEEKSLLLNQNQLSFRERKFLYQKSISSAEQQSFSPNSYFFSTNISLLNLLQFFQNNFGIVDLPKRNIFEVKNMNSMFKGCKLLISLPDISKWDTSNVNNMSNMFNNLIA